MKTAEKTDKIIVCVLALLVVLALVWQLLPVRKGIEPDKPGETVSYEDYNGKTIGILSGTNLEDTTFQYFPDSQYLYFDGYPNLNTALENGIIDAFLGDEPALKSIHAQKPQIDYIKERLTYSRYSFAFRKDDPEEKALCDQFNDFLRKIKADKTYDEIDSLWFSTDEDRKVVDLSGLSGENGTLRVVTTSTDEPFSYIKDGNVIGYDIDVTARFCREYGYGLEIIQVDYPARIPALAAKRCEFTTTMNVTAEREEVVLFSEPVSEGGIVVAVRSEDLPSSETADDGANAVKSGFIAKCVESFRKNFIREQRWKLILRGIGTTCLITVCSILLGTVLAFGICFLRRTGSRLANMISDIYVRILQGIPTVVLLMILFYVVFARTGLKPVTVAIIGFAMNFGAYASEIIRSGIDSIDPGQREAALAIGFSETQAFFRFILPQAAMNFLSVYRGEAVSLLKSTSVVGYIAIQDLTKMSDIIRSRTYEAFFPLFTTALMYFLLAWIIALLVSRLLKQIDPKHGGERKGAVS